MRERGQTVDAVWTVALSTVNMLILRTLSGSVDAWTGVHYKTEKLSLWTFPGE